MFDNYFNDLEYKEYAGMSQTGQANSFKEARYIKGIRLKGQLKFTHGNDGDTTTCTIVYKTKEYIVKGSKLEDREVVECVKVAAFGRDHGYMVYVK